MRRSPDNRHARWQEHVLAKAIGLEHRYELLAKRAIHYENNRTGSLEVPSAVSVRAALDEYLRAARSMALLRETLRLRPISRLAARAIDAAFVNLHAAEVVLVDLYQSADIESRTPDVLARLRACMPAADERLVRAEEMFGAGRPMQQAPGLTDSQPSPPSDDDNTAPSPTEPFAVRRATFREAMEVSMKRPMSCTPAPAASATC